MIVLEFSPSSHGGLLLVISMYMVMLLLSKGAFSPPFLGIYRMKVKTHLLFADFLLLFDRPMCPYSVLIIGWRCSNPTTEATGTLDSVP